VAQRPDFHSKKPEKISEVLYIRASKGVQFPRSFSTYDVPLLRGTMQALQTIKLSGSMEG